MGTQLTHAYVAVHCKAPSYAEQEISQQRSSQGVTAAREGLLSHTFATGSPERVFAGCTQTCSGGVPPSLPGTSDPKKGNTGHPEPNVHGKVLNDSITIIHSMLLGACSCTQDTTEITNSIE